MDHAWLAPSLTELYGRMAVTFKPIREALSQFLVWDKAELCFCWQIGWWIADDTHTHTLVHTHHTRREVRRLLSLHLDCPQLSFFFFSRFIFFASAHTGMFSVSVQIWLELGCAPCLIKPKLLANRENTTGWMNGWMDGWVVGGRVCEASSGFNMCSSSHILGCFNMNSYLWKAMNS